MVELWLKILDIMDRLMNSGQGDSLVSRLVSFVFSASRLMNRRRMKQYRKA